MKPRFDLAMARGAVGALVVVALLFTFGGCSKTSDITDPAGDIQASLGNGRAGHDVDVVGPQSKSQDGSQPPAGLTSVSFGGRQLTLWPYTGSSFDGTPSDPVNCIFVGQADPVRIRAALMALDGDRTAFGLPPVFPFNATWSDANGDVQTNFADGEGWTGSVIQLQLGSYDPIRVHLRLFRTGQPFGEGGQWTVGAAHFEVLIPGTADHQVVSWEVAEQLVTIDMTRAGLLDATAPMMPTGVINQTPSFREIPAVVYNGLPPELVALIKGPPQPVSAPVPIDSDGQGTIFNLAQAAPFTAGPTSQSFTLTYNQVVPRPICSTGPTDYILIQGPITIHKETTLDATGRFEFTGGFQANLTAVPVDVTQNPPVPAGAPFPVVVNENQNGFLGVPGQFASVHSQRLAPGGGGTEFQKVDLRVGTQGENAYSLRIKCQ